MSDTNTAADGLWTVGRLLKWTSDYFAQHEVDTPRLDAEILLAKAMKCARIELYTKFNDPASDEARALYREYVKKHASGMPTAYLIGEKEFYSLSFKVSPDVLIPRPETEHLVIEVLDIIKNSQVKLLSQQDKTEGLTENSENKPGISEENTVTDSQTGEAYIKFVPKGNPLKEIQLNFLDIGTGSGVIPVCLAKNLPKCRFSAVDISEPALEIARQNAKAHKVESQIEFRRSDLFSSVKSDEKYDFIVSNPPYIGESERDTIDSSVLNYEPQQALFSGEKGTDLIEKMIAQAPDYLNPGGWLLFEMSPIIHESVINILNNQTKMKYIKTVSDLAKLPRIVVCRKNQ